MFQWIRELLDIRYEYKERKGKLKRDALICNSCETLRTALERANYEREQLLNNLLKPQVQSERVEAPEPSSVPLQRNRHTPLRVMQQQLELEDREKARVIRDFEAKLVRERNLKEKLSPKANTEINVNPQIETLEKELGIQ